MARFKIHDTAIKPETAVLVSVITPSVTETKAKEYLEELEFLVQTAGGETKGMFTQKLGFPDRATFVGSGKLEEIKAYVEAEEIDIVVFDDELSPSQLRNIEKELKRKILDRSNLILDIFARHAKTAQAKTQVELAQLQYLLPRLTRMWTHLERQRGGIGMRGPGESQIETDRRIILDKISLFKERLKAIDKQNETQRKNRGEMIRVALVGYTNVGKSTIMNMISKSDVLIENKLFATLDTTVRKVVIDNLPFLLSDTVGFIRKLPHHLVECFKSTLDEVREADVLIHVVDISHPNFEDHIQAVNETLKDLKALDKPVITVFNKIDLYKPAVEEGHDGEEIEVTLDDFRNSWMAKNSDPAIFLSATNKTNIEEFKQKLYDIIVKMHNERYPYNNLLY
ncbi:MULTISPECIES: GTPase HflX [Sphingobacterium]|jgi:GTP-binding protein HflX|uniref:GTPase HflX n=3 Tax=Sphingobacterium TaxID=28453 RepID=A0A420FMI4_9SPHI|nr:MULTISPECIES: GTPase HflX [Sphingobacterium]APU99481.1 GTPase HflX [Sphingobacterium sp. B29]QMV70177.1 GTPase HflX [Sphingobacterium paramultivorum]QQT30445.1 GTPase HflX [Sphingobacterium multivorum]QQT53577.1 GTPase HflX [Sphingobacterium multivorum]QRY58733.1 GTPase HflX [Sphingobacterium siyangense]